MKKRIAVFSVLLLILSLTACGGPKHGSTQDGKLVWYMGGNNTALGEQKKAEDLFADIPDTIEPGKIYDSLVYTEEMLYGSYALNDLGNDINSVRKDVPFEEVVFNNGTFSISTLPVSVCFGAEHISGTLTGYNYSAFEDITDAHVAALTFATADDVGHVPCIYEVNGKQIVFRAITEADVDAEAGAYQLQDVTFQYDFSLVGPHLTLSRDGVSQRLTSYCFTENVESGLGISAYSKPDSALIAELDCFSCDEAWNYAMKRDGSYYSRSAYKLSDDGLFTIYLESMDANGQAETFIQQYVYIAQSKSSGFNDKFGLILFDGTKQYNYTDNILSREERELKEQGKDTTGMSDADIQAIAEKRSDLFSDLASAFQEQGIAVTIDRSTGEIAMAASVLFSGDSAEITADGKALLDQFLTAYTSIIFNEKYEGFIEKTMIEGHTAPLASSTYESGLPLSTARANTVKDYCLVRDADTGSRLASSLEAVGLSNSKPIYNTDGEIDTDACRRVSFRFIVHI